MVSVSTGTVVVVPETGEDGDGVTDGETTGEVVPFWLGDGEDGVSDGEGVEDGKTIGDEDGVTDGEGVEDGETTDEVVPF